MGPPWKALEGDGGERTVISRQKHRVYVCVCAMQCSSLLSVYVQYSTDTRTGGGKGGRSAG